MSQPRVRNVRPGDGLPGSWEKGPPLEEKKNCGESGKKERKKFRDDEGSALFLLSLTTLCHQVLPTSFFPFEAVPRSVLKEELLPLGSL